MLDIEIVIADSIVYVIPVFVQMLTPNFSKYHINVVWKHKHLFQVHNIHVQIPIWGMIMPGIALIMVVMFWGL
jgi:phosphoribulokinase